jgi:hypothetical protein
MDEWREGGGGGEDVLVSDGVDVVWRELENYSSSA